MTARAAARIAGVDLARGLAVFGMFAAHVGPEPRRAGLLEPLMQLTHGRSSVLFATLAGLSLALITGRRRPDATWRQAARIAIRAVVLVVLGTFLTMLGTPIAVILAYYGIYFLLALPFIRLRAPALFSIAGVVALGGPILALFARNEWRTWNDPLERLSGEGALQFLLIGYYPAVSWMAYVLVGMGLGRLDLAAASTRVRFAITGPVLIALGYGGSSFLLSHARNPSPRRDEPGWLLESSPHSDTTFDIAGTLGVALTVLAIALPLADRLPRLMKPITAVGTMSLSVYTAHLIAIKVFDVDVPGNGVQLLLFIAGAMVFALAWLAFLRRGPLEYLLTGVTRIVPRGKGDTVRRGAVPG